MSITGYPPADPSRPATRSSHAVTEPALAARAFPSSDPPRGHGQASDNSETPATPSSPISVI
jgi:hypothetical protein